MYYCTYKVSYYYVEVAIGLRALLLRSMSRLRLAGLVVFVRRNNPLDNNNKEKEKVLSCLNVIPVHIGCCMTTTARNGPSSIIPLSQAVTLSICNIIILNTLNAWAVSRLSFSTFFQVSIDDINKDEFHGRENAVAPY